MDSAPLEPFVQVIQDPAESGRGNSAQKPRAGRKAPVGTDQMFAPCGHCATYRRLRSTWQATGLPPPTSRFTVNGPNNGQWRLAFFASVGKVLPRTASRREMGILV
jgi:hypothetical protein